MSDNKKQKLIPLSAVPQVVINLTGVQRCRGTIYAWTKKGCRTVDGRIVKLKTTKRLKQIFTTEQDIKHFIEQVG